MTIRKKTYKDAMVIDLTGSDGNAFVLLGTAKNLSREYDEDFDAVYAEMTESDYENLVEVFDKYFGNYVTLLR